MTVNDIYKYIDSIAPFYEQAEWDNAGLLVGDASAHVTKAIVALDITASELSQAKRIGAELIISHHPVIFGAKKSFLAGDICYEVAKSGISAICAHTNLDKAPGGVNDVLCEVLGMEYEKMPADCAEGFLNIGSISGIASAKQLAEYICEKLRGAVRYCDAGVPVTRIGVCSGAGGDFVAEAASSGCNAFITGDASYHEFLDAADAGVSLFAAGHFETEIIIVNKLIKDLSLRFPDIVFVPSERAAPIVTVM